MRNRRVAEEQPLPPGKCIGAEGVLRAWPLEGYCCSGSEKIRNIKRKTTKKEVALDKGCSSSEDYIYFLIQIKLS